MDVEVIPVLDVLNGQAINRFVPAILGFVFEVALYGINEIRNREKQERKPIFEESVVELLRVRFVERHAIDASIGEDVFHFAVSPLLLCSFNVDLVHRFTSCNVLVIKIMDEYGHGRQGNLIVFCGIGRVILKVLQRGSHNGRVPAPSKDCPNAGRNGITQKRSFTNQTIFAFLLFAD